MPEMRLKQPGFPLVDHLLETRKQYKPIKKQEAKDTFVKTNSTKSAFSMIWFKKILRIYLENSCWWSINTAKNSKYVERGFDGLFFFLWEFVWANTSSCAIKNEIMSNKQLAEKLHKPIIRKFEKRKVYSFLYTWDAEDNIGDVDLQICNWLVH